MKGKTFFICFFWIALILFAICFMFQFFTKDEIIEFEEYIPEEEISEEQERQTLVTLYFQDKESKVIMPEARLIDVKKLINNPCEVLINLLLEGPKNEKFTSVIPKGTKLNDVTVQGNMAIVDFSTDFIREIKLGAVEENKIVYSIVNTLTELSEIESVKILIDGHEGTAFDDKAIDFKNPFVRID